MSCWKWFNSMLEEAGVEVTEENRERIDRIIHEYIADRADHGRCSHLPQEASGQISSDRTMRQELIGRLRQEAAVRTVKS